MKSSEPAGGHRLLIGLLAGLGLILAAPAGAAESAAGKPEPAALSVRGLGWWNNRESRVTLERLLGEERGPAWDANAIEDAVFLLLAELQADGYLRPRITAAVERGDGAGASEEYVFDHELTTLLPRDLTARGVQLRVERGVRYRVETVAVSGLTALPEAAAESIFLEEAGLLTGLMKPSYVPARARANADTLAERLRDRGYADATVQAREAQVDHATGEVQLAIEVREGPRWLVAKSAVSGMEALPVTAGKIAPDPGVVWSPGRRQEIVEAVRREAYSAGFPDVRVNVSTAPAPERGGVRRVDVRVEVALGEQVKIGTTRFAGLVHTRPELLQRRVRVESGALLDPRRLEQARARLGRLGVFSAVDVDLEPAEGPVRDAVFTFREAPRWETSLLAGYGSYEQLRAGVELRQWNLFGRAHSSRLLLVQSLKSSRGEYSYTVPELFGESVDGTAKIFGLQREELAFLRQEYGGSVTLQRAVPFIGAIGTAGYTFQSLRNKDNELVTRAIDEEQVIVASVDLGLSRDRRDNPLRPRRGYRWFTNAEIANTVLGGEVNYERFELGASYHRPAGRGRWLHVGLTHGVITTLGADDDRTLPVNKRFFPGGESSIRGFQDGEAAPRGPDGRFIGAKSYALLNLEFEQALTRSWSAVVFVDALGMAERLGDYPSSEELYSLGLGLRYQTIVGPVRLEYGHNLNRRDGDPSGTLHLSVGFPF
ncbi:MAG TPA: BamA/TamA family outer membrane protein [Opitutaceae bacterium]